MRVPLFVMLIFLLLLPACRREVDDARLLRAEALVEDHPDSTLAILDSIGEAGVKGRLNRAAYAMLRGMAMDKAGLVPANDSAMSAAADEFAAAGDRRRETVTRYYLGRVRYLAGDHTGALLSYFRAKELAEQDSAHFWAGMSCRGIAETYKSTYCPTDALIYASKEQDYFRKCNSQPYLNYSLCDIAEALLMQGKIAEAVSVTDQMLDSASRYEDDILRYLAMQTKGAAYVFDENYTMALPLYTQILESGYADISDSLQYALITASLGRTEEARQILAVMPDVSDPLRNQVQSVISYNEGDLAKAWDERNRMDTVTDRKWRNRVDGELQVGLAEYLSLKEKLVSEKLYSSRIIIFGGVIFLIVLTVAGWRLYIVHRQRLKDRIQEQLFLIESLNEELSKSEDISGDAYGKIRKLISSKIKILDKVGLCVADILNKNLSTKAIQERLATIVDGISLDNENFIELESYANLFHDNIMDDLRMDLPGLKEKDYRLFLLVMSGVSSGTVTLLLKETNVTSVYERKRRLKDKLASLPKEKYNRYLSFL